MSLGGWGTTESHAIVFRINVEITMRERVKFDIPAVHAESNHFTSKQCHCQSLTFYPRKESPHMVNSLVGVRGWYPTMVQTEKEAR